MRHRQRIAYLRQQFCCCLKPAGNADMRPNDPVRLTAFMKCFQLTHVETSTQRLAENPTSERYILRWSDVLVSWLSAARAPGVERRQQARFQRAQLAGAQRRAVDAPWGGQPLHAAVQREPGLRQPPLRCARDSSTGAVIDSLCRAITQYLVIKCWYGSPGSVWPGKPDLEGLNKQFGHEVINRRCRPAGPACMLSEALPCAWHGVKTASCDVRPDAYAAALSCARPDTARHPKPCVLLQRVRWNTC